MAESAPTIARSSLDILTLGCRLNAYESEVMRGHAQAAGVEDAVIVNTCAVTAEAVRQARQAIRRARRERPNASIIVTGCAAQIDPASFAEMPEVTRVIGNAEKMKAETFAGMGITAGEGMPHKMDAKVKEAWLWDTYGEGVRDALKDDPKREFGMIHRFHWTAQSDILDAFKDYPGPFEFSLSPQAASTRLQASSNVPRNGIFQSMSVRMARSISRIYAGPPQGSKVAKA